MLLMWEIIKLDHPLSGIGLGTRLLMFNRMELLVIARSVAYTAHLRRMLILVR